MTFCLYEAFNVLELFKRVKYGGRQQYVWRSLISLSGFCIRQELHNVRVLCNMELYVVGTGWKEIKYIEVVFVEKRLVLFLLRNESFGFCKRRETFRSTKTYLADVLCFAFCRT